MTTRPPHCGTPARPRPPGRDHPADPVRPRVVGHLRAAVPALVALLGLGACVDPDARPVTLPLQVGADLPPRAADDTVVLALGPLWEVHLSRAELRLTAATLRAPADAPRWGDTPPLGTDPVPADPDQGHVVGSWVGVRWVDLLDGDGQTVDATTGRALHTVGRLTAWEGPVGTLDLALQGEPALYLEGRLHPRGALGAGLDPADRAVPVDLALPLDRTLTGVALPDDARLEATVPPDASALAEGLALGERTGEAGPLVVTLDLAAVVAVLPRPRQPLPRDPTSDRGRDRPRPVTPTTPGVAEAVAVGLGSAGAWEATLQAAAVPDPLASLLPSALDDADPAGAPPRDTGAPSGEAP